MRNNRVGNEIKGSVYHFLSQIGSKKVGFRSVHPCLAAASIGTVLQINGYISSILSDLR